jgi:predicted O-linked N-acetylglucosamine transferase (SPINDLY family)
MSNIDKAIKYHQQGKLVQAEKLYKKILKSDNKNFDAWHLLGVVDYQRDKVLSSIDKINKAISLNPNEASFYSNIGLSYLRINNIDNALQSLQKAISLAPNYPEALNNLANALSTKGLIKESILYYKKAIQLIPNYYEALYNLGNALFSIDNDNEALEYYKKALSINPNYSNTYIGIAILLKKTKQYTQSMQYFNQGFTLGKVTNRYALSSYYELKREICDWKDIDILEHKLINSTFSNSHTSSLIEPFTIIAMLRDIDAKQQNLLIEKYTKNEVQTKIQQNNIAFTNEKRIKNKRIKLAYISPNFYNQASMHLVSGMFQYHDKNKFETYIYATDYEEDSPYYINAKKDIEHFIDLKNWDTQQIIDKIRNDNIDILIDLRSHGKKSNANIVASRVAPIQISFVNFAGTTANTNVDYIVVDKTLVLDNELDCYSEKPIFMPNCYMPTNDMQLVSSKIPSKKELNLPQDSFVFCNFNTLYKVEPKVFEIWMNILKKVNNSVLWLLKSNDIAMKNLKEKAHKFGIDPNRLIFANIITKSEHLARLKHADLFLDTFSCNAHTSAIDCLYVDVPLITVYGKTYASRAASSFLKTIKLEELICQNADEYENLAIKISKDSIYKNNLKKNLIENKKNLFNTKQYILDLENICESLYKETS